jgi:HD-GYP domain-containing protein (c-di-GMP phosphodiesterase class II)
VKIVQPQQQLGALKVDLSPEDMLRVIFGYTAKIANEKNIDNVLKYMADMGREMVVADRCTLWLLDKQRGQLWTKVAHNLDEIRVPANAGFVGHTVQTGEALLIEDAYEDERFNQEVDRLSGYRTKSILCTPIMDNEGRIIGAFQAVNKMTAGGVFLQKDLESLTLAAYYVGRAIESAMLYHEIEETQKEIIFCMGEIGESRSKETGFHVKRVAEYSKLIALRYGLCEEDAEMLKVISPMHDIGKVAIPDSILKKPGKLTDEEFEIMKTHTTIGYELLKNSKRKLLQNAAIVAIQHHEKWNGKGYPYGLKGEDIHIFGRITAVADVFDALGSDRCYKKAWELDRIIKLFQEERGQHFDPKLVDILLDNLDEFLVIRDRYKDDKEPETL